MEAQASGGNKATLATKLRALKPLLWCLAFVGLLAIYQVHRNLSEKTRLRFSAHLEGSDNRPEAKVDGQSLEMDGKVGIGFHNFSIEHPKGKTFSTNLFIWYGGKDLGAITLERLKGKLTLSAEPTAPLVRIRGPEFRAEFPNLSETNLLIPTDDYIVEAEYPSWDKRLRVRVSDSFMPEVVSFQPKFGALKLTATASNARYKLISSERLVIAEGTLPAEIHYVPAGNYTFSAETRRGKREMNVVAESRATNEYHLDFKLGAASIETTPAGASVLTDDGRKWGETPLIIAELDPGQWNFSLQREGYQTALVSVGVESGKTNTSRTELVDSQFATGVGAAQKYLAAGNFGRALQSAQAALRVNPTNGLANELAQRASGLENLRIAKDLAAREDFTEAIRMLNLSIQTLPTNDEARQLLPKYQEAEKSQAKRKHDEWLTRGRRLFASTLNEFQSPDLFEKHEFRIDRPLTDLELAITQELKAGDPVFLVTSRRSPEPDTFILRATFEMPLLSTRSGRRTVMFVGTKVSDTETEVLYKILEYKIDPNRSSYNNPVYMPIHPSAMGGSLPTRLSNQINEGLADIKARMERVRHK